MKSITDLLENNRIWAERISAEDPEFFSRLSHQQTPKYLWIGCADSRVPANEIVGLEPGELFVHRNVANLVIHTDMNCLSVLEYAVDVLHVEHIIVCGHYGCGGIAATLKQQSYGLVDNWLRHVGDIVNKYTRELSAMTSEKERSDFLCEMNVIEQVINVCNTTIVRDTWLRGQDVSVHGMIYAVEDGLLRDMHVHAASDADLQMLLRR
ncbi:MAG: carbonate dehydratase [Spirochaetes bacterium]|nr:carbonate dehydratase [Spirochaetota bacterium]